MTETELRTVTGWSAASVESLEKSGINTAEQVVAVSATDGGINLLSRELGVSESETARLVDLARHALSPDARAAMDQKVDSDDRGLGARNPK